MDVIARNDHPGTPSESAAIATLRPGDVIAFHMSHSEAWTQLRKGKIQKIPYDLFRYGHIALIVPDPGNDLATSDLRLLQIAMKQAANADAATDYLEGKHWVAYRPCGDLDLARLHGFSRQVTITAGNAEHAYDYAGVLGLRNKPYQPDSISEIGGKFSCATLVVAGLHYSGCHLDAVHRNGWFDIVTPGQVVDSSVRQEKKTPHLLSGK
ncbi:hypothetical protein HZ994_05240 [Akkermansiaceae bacterium]|nr:hypothetical protein HZ994_05240 [Akkermansiaceae bacterium]